MIPSLEVAVMIVKDVMEVVVVVVVECRGHLCVNEMRRQHKKNQRLGWRGPYI